MPRWSSTTVRSAAAPSAVGLSVSLVELPKPRLSHVTTRKCWPSTGTWRYHTACEPPAPCDSTTTGRVSPSPWSVSSQ